MNLRKFRSFAKFCPDGQPILEISSSDLVHITIVLSVNLQALPKSL